MKLSYAQNLEDYHLDLVFADVPAGTYVDVGGGHPVADNVSFYAYLKGWRGLVVEPQDDLARLYAGIRPRDHVVSNLAGRTSGTIDFHVVAGMHGLSSAIAANAESARRYGAETRTVSKRVEPLSVLIDQAAISTIDFLKIDVEGAEPDVLAGLDLTRHRPRVILVEAVNPNNLAADVSAWEPGLLDAGYTFAFFDNLNRFYVAREHAGLVARFPAAPAPWTTVDHLWDCGRAHTRTDHPDRALTDVLVAGLLAELPHLAATQPALLQGLIERGRITAGGPKSSPVALATLLGTAEHPRPASHTEAATTERLLASDQFRAALGRIACMYDGGHLLE
jgi:FkbM family methyltransferase